MNLEICYHDDDDDDDCVLYACVCLFHMYVCLPLILLVYLAVATSRNTHLHCFFVVSNIFLVGITVDTQHIFWPFKSN